MLNLSEQFCFPINQSEFWKIIKISDLFVRPTRSDSFGISIQEALFCNVPAIASDVCIRPEKTILFRSGDEKDFILKATDILRRKTYEAKASGDHRSRTGRADRSL